MADHLAVAVLGTGIMGAAMARNLCRAGHDVRVWNRTPAKAEALVADGARAFATPAEAVADADVVLTMVYDGPAALEAVTAAGPGLRPGAIWLQTTTVGIEAVPSLADLARHHGLVFIDAPVLGTKAPAESGDLLILAAGPEAARAPLASVLDAIGSRTVWLGEDGSTAAASRLKLVCNSWVIALTNGAAEALALAKGLDVDPRYFLEAMAGGSLDCGYLHAKAAVIMEGDYTPSFSVATAGKDARLIVEAGTSAGVRLDVAAASAERFRRAEAQGHGDEDMAATYFASFDG
ncbi:NAD(P)-dependent oxidoreductase [Streptomyces scopuliridis]|uniref:NAD(P)-dependent oxidoreductase n=1 Tax=Streptomyces scopuliridis TaxID=452529 RepID=A0ACD4ZPJ2_9ACTN|nr:NAD(P)-dependent oxidoreductase [Streptomyces scopuliridis]WSB36012.1 NAD(P)-dependent oxidoreductase [Streptomyces scopuliridis]WSC00314.1 NAD(P)-dependent oxidoreductase [Streptomyces scopuliridis]WSC06075.1 NAD(P)-dependent oxidoreductase [Streptomyces scopuliridis]